MQSVFGQATGDSVDTEMEQQLKSLTQQLEIYERLLNQSNEAKKQDSLSGAELLKQIQQLQAGDNAIKLSLLEQISEIEQQDSLRTAQQKQDLIALRASTGGFVVTPFGDSLFTIYAGLGPLTAETRALYVTDKIELLIRDNYFYPDSLYTREGSTTIDIMYRNLIVIGISGWDVLWEQRGSKEALAKLYKDRIADGIIEARSRSSVDNIAARIGLVFLIIGCVFLVLYFIGKLTNRIQRWMGVNKSRFFKGINIRNFELLPPSLHLDVSIRAVSTLKWGAYALVFYLSLPLIFGLFPFTRSWAQTLMDWILSPARNVWFGFWSYLPNVFTIVVIYLITRYLVKFLRFIAGEVENGTLNLPGFYSDWAMPTYRLAKILIYAFMVVMIYPHLPGSESDVFKGVSIFLGLLIVFGSTSAISNVVAGLVITYMRPFRIGDRVKIGEVTGEIVAKALLVTRVRTSKNEDVTVPNSSILTGHTINYTSSSKELGLILNTSVTISYNVPWKKVHDLLIDAAIDTNGVIVSKEPFVLQTSLDDIYVTYQLNAYTDTPEKMPTIYSELHANIQDKFKETNIEILTPRYPS